MADMLFRLFDTSGFPARWNCGNWSALHGWTHIVSDLAIFGAYAAIPAALAFFVLRRRDVPFQNIFWLFVAFILSCGAGHLLEALIFWVPMYRLAGTIKVLTAIVSWATALALIPMLPRALAWPGLATINRRLEEEIANRKQAEQRIRLVIESAPNGMVMVDHYGRIVLFNRQAEDLFGYRAAELLGKSVETLVPERHRRGHAEARNAFLARPEPRAMGAGRDLFGQRKDGSEFPVEIGLTPFETEEGDFVLSAVVDITERKRAEEQMTLLRNQLAHASRLGTLGELTFGLAHELNQPLAALHLYADTALKLGTTQNWSEIGECLSQISRESLRAGEIVRRIRSFATPAPPRRTSVAINQLIQEVLSILAVELRHSNVALRLALGDNLPVVFADPIQIQQVLVNLIRNALESMTESEVSRRSLTISSISFDGGVRVTVADTGSGIAPSITDKLFHPFQTTKRSGLGLGLAICRTLIETHRGQIGTESNPGGGTVFYFSIPVSHNEQTNSHIQR